MSITCCSSLTIARHDLSVALGLIYRMLVKLLSWLVLGARSDTSKDIEILSCATSSPCSIGARHPRR
jgi:hypothetical protein